MYLDYLKSNRYKITRNIFLIFLIVSVLNLVFVSSVITFAEDEDPVVENLAPTEVSTEIVAEAEIVQTEQEESTIQPEIQNELPELQIETQEEVVETGDAEASVNVINEINTNIVDSNVTISAESGSLDSSSLDLRENFEEQEETDCGQFCANDISVENQNSASIENNIVVEANTGDNAVLGEDASIITGDAFAGVNVVNIANTNIVKSNYVILAFNNFGDWSGDLILPNGDFFKTFLNVFSPKCQNCEEVDILNQNNASVSNSIITSTETGENIAGINGVIDSGNTLAYSNIYNQINTSIYGNSSFFVLIKVFGNWDGNIFNLPDGISWAKTPDGLMLFDQNTNPFENQAEISNNGNLFIQNQNSADVVNNIEASASSGKNKVSGENGTIVTGNAYAASNVVNIINTNVVSSNWTTALLNIFGDWSGNVSFGQPDLWVGAVAQTSGSLSSGSYVQSKITVKNNGDSTASGIKVSVNPQSDFFRISGDKEWFLSPLKPGESVDIVFGGSLNGLNPGHTNITNIISASLYETDANPNDNTDTLVFSAYQEAGIILPYTNRSSTYPKIEVTKSHFLQSSINLDGIEMVPFGGSADYKIVVKNSGGSAYEGILFDELKNEAGEIMGQQHWILGEILPNEEITITYTTQFNEEIKPGIYTNLAWVEALGGDYSFDPIDINSNIAIDKIIIAKKQVVWQQQPEIERPVPEILGAHSEDILINTTEPEDFLNGFCFVEEQKPKKEKNDGVFKNVILGLSFILIMQRRNKISSNLFIF